MGRLIYSAMISLDGYIADESGSFDWAVPDAETHAFANDLVRPAGTHLYGRRTYEVMAAWDTVPDDGSLPPAEEDFASIWRDSDKIVYSRTLASVDGARTTLERDFAPAAVRRLKQTAERDLVIGGPGLATTALQHTLVDEVQLLIWPVLVGGGTPGWPAGARTRLELSDECRLSNGVVHLRYDVVGAG